MIESIEKGALQLIPIWHCSKKKGSASNVAMTMETLLSDGRSRDMLHSEFGSLYLVYDNQETSSVDEVLIEFLRLWAWSSEINRDLQQLGVFEVSGGSQAS